MTLTDRMVWLFVLVGAALIAAGCADPLRAATLTANAAAVSLTATHAELVAHRKAAQVEAAKRVQGDRALASVREEQRDRATMVGRRYRAAFAAYETCRQVWVAAVASIRVASEAQAAGGALDLSTVVDALRALAMAQQRLYKLTHENTGLLGDGPPPGGQ